MIKGWLYKALVLIALLVVIAACTDREAWKYRGIAPQQQQAVAFTSLPAVTIKGEIRNPGQYAYVKGMQVLNVVAVAGGYTGRAVREGAEIHRFKTETGAEMPLVVIEATPETLVFPDDKIIIRNRFVDF